MFRFGRATSGKVSIIGHRGAPDCAPENTLASFKEALAQGADIVELDVQLAADEHVVVFHDEHLERTSDGHGALAEHSLAELQSLDAGSWFAPRFVGESIPNLDQVLAWAKDRVPLFIELKHGSYATPELDAQTVELVRAHGLQERVVLISFDHPALRRVKGLAPELAVGPLYVAQPDDPITLARSIPAESLHPHWTAVEADEVARCHRAGLAVAPWGAGMDYPRMLATGVDAFNADHPARVRREFLLRK